MWRKQLKPNFVARDFFFLKYEFLSFQFSTSVLSSDPILSVINARVSVESLELL